MSVGIDEISFYTSSYYFDLRVLAEIQNTDPEKYYVGIGQEKMGMAAPDEDVVTMAANAALPLIERVGPMLSGPCCLPLKPASTSPSPRASMFTGCWG